MFLLLISSIVLFLIFTQLMAYLHLKKYEKQGIKIMFVPVLGTLYLLVKGAKTNDQDSASKKLYEENLDEDMIAVNMSGISGKGVILVKSPEAVSSFVKNEKNALKTKFMDSDFVGFFGENGKKAMKKKAVFSKIFHQDNLESLCPVMADIIDSHIQILKRDKVSKDRWTQIELKEEFFRRVFEDFTQKILFGNEELKTIPNLENGESIVVGISKTFHLFFQIMISKVNIFTFGLARKLNLLPEKKQFDEIRRQAKKIVLKLYKERLQEKESKRKAVNFMDSLIEHNQTCKENEKLNLDDIYGNFELFQFAASDTSFQVTTSALVLLAKKENREILEELYKELDLMSDNAGQVTRNELDSAEYLMKVIQETMRMNAPVVRNSPRKLIGDIEILGKRIFKGDRILLCQSALNFNPKIHKNPKKFDPERFNTENEKNLPRNSFIPFSVGKRNCVGQYLGKMMVKITLSRFLKNFDIQEVEGYQLKLKGFALSGYENAVVNIRSK